MAGAPPSADVTGYWPSPWPAEDGGPARLAVSAQGPGFAITPGEHLAVTTRNTLMSTMTVLGDPGEVYLLTHSALRAQIGLPTTSRVERIDPVTLTTIDRSPRLPGGPMWPGGMAVHANGDLYVVYGRWAHRLDRRCGLKASLRLPLDLAYNSFAVLANGLIVTKNLSETVDARLTVIDPASMAAACADIDCPEPSIARLSAVGNEVYVVGVRSIFRYRWIGGTLTRDPDWRFDYTQGTRQSHGWDVVLGGAQAWFMDNGRHRYRTSMIGRGVVPTPNRLIRVSLADAADHETIEVSGIASGSVTNPPLVDPVRKIAVGLDSANRVLAAWRFEGGLTPLWRKDRLGAASHMLLDPGSGQIVTNDYAPRTGEAVVVLDIETGTELARATVGGLMQGVVFPSIGWNRDLYWCSMGKLARISIVG
jgi:DNA-binding beta-propeller fold protein YncE